MRLNTFGHNEYPRVKSKIPLHIKQVMTIPIGISISLVLFSFTLGWNLWTLLFFWFILVPGLTYSFPVLIFKEKVHPIQAIIGLLIFYALLIFMIYDHFQSDYFKIMILSLVTNMILVGFYNWVKHGDRSIKADLHDLETKS